MNLKPIHLRLGLSFAAAALVIAAWVYASARLDESRRHIASSLLDPAAALLIQNQALIKELQTEPFGDKDASILVAYLAKIRRDGLPKHKAMKQRLERLADNHVAIVTLLTAYAPHARTPGLAAAADRFRKAADDWRSAWNATMELFMAGGNQPETEVPLPAGLLAAVQAEQAAAR